MLLPGAPGLHIISPGREKHHKAECWDTCKEQLQIWWGKAPWCRDLHEPCHPWISPHWCLRIASITRWALPLYSSIPAAEGQQIPLGLAQGTAPSPWHLIHQRQLPAPLGPCRAGGGCEVRSSTTSPGHSPGHSPGQGTAKGTAKGTAQPGDGSS